MMGRAQAVKSFAKIGTELKNKREESSYTLTQVAEITRISPGNLKNIEQGDLEELPGLVFVRGFIRNYAKLLNLDSDEMISELNKIYGHNALSDNQSPSNGNIDNIQKPKGNYWIIGIVIGILCLIGILYFTVWKPKEFKQTKNNQTNQNSQTKNNQTNQNSQTKSNQTNQNSQTKSNQTNQNSQTKSNQTNQNSQTLNNQTSQNSQATNNQTSQNSQATTNQISQSSKTATKKKVAIKPLSLLLKGKAKGWVRLKIDNKDAFEFKVRGGQSYEWPAKTQYQLTISTGNIVSIYLNGEEIEVTASEKNLLINKKLNKFSLTKLNN
ncbi:MAG: cytoskeletal protein RodZ [bacterium]|jgi:cytoskeletal protein RodZ